MEVSNNIDRHLIDMRDNCVLMETAVLNTLDKTIILTVLSGNVREIFALIQGVASLIFAIDYAHRSMSATGEERAKLQENAWFCIDMTKHAFLNFGRAKIASYNKVAQVVTAAVLMMYDWGLKDRQKYIGESETPVQSRLATVYINYAGTSINR